MVSSRNKGSKFLKKPWCSVDGRVWQGNLCLSNLELSPFVRAIESLWRARNLNSLRWPVFVINSVWLPRKGECPTLLRQAGGLHFYWISGTQESGDYYRRAGVGGGWVNLPDPHIRFCNIPHWLLNCSSFFPLQTLWSMWSILVGVLMCYQLILYWHRLRSKTKVTMLCIRNRQTRCTSWDPFDLLNYRAMFWKNKTGNQF